LVLLGETRSLWASGPAFFMKCTSKTCHFGVETAGEDRIAVVEDEPAGMIVLQKLAKLITCAIQ